MSEMFAVPERVKTVMTMLVNAAEAGHRCPSNNEIAGAINASSVSGGTNAIALLESMNLIKVYRGNQNRVIEIVATGKRTAGKITNLHWRLRAGGPPIKPRPTAKADRRDQWSSNDDALLMERVAEGDDFDQAGYLIGKSASVCAARFDQLAARMGWQAQ